MSVNILYTFWQSGVSLSPVIKEPIPCKWKFLVFLNDLFLFLWLIFAPHLSGIGEQRIALHQTVLCVLLSGDISLFHVINWKYHGVLLSYHTHYSFVSFRFFENYFPLCDIHIWHVFFLMSYLSNHGYLSSFVALLVSPTYVSACIAICGAVSLFQDCFCKVLGIMCHATFCLGDMYGSAWQGCCHLLHSKVTSNLLNCNQHVWWSGQDHIMSCGILCASYCLKVYNYVIVITVFINWVNKAYVFP